MHDALALALADALGPYPGTINRWWSEVEEVYIQHKCSSMLMFIEFHVRFTNLLILLGFCNVTYLVSRITTLPWFIRCVEGSDGSSSVLHWIWSIVFDAKYTLIILLQLSMWCSLIPVRHSHYMGGIIVCESVRVKYTCTFSFHNRTIYRSNLHKYILEHFCIKRLTTNKYTLYYWPYTVLLTIHHTCIATSLLGGLSLRSDIPNYKYVSA